MENLKRRTATFDLETNGFLEDATVVWCAVVQNHETKTNKLFTPDNINELPIYLGSFDVLIGHNSVAFDFPVLRKIYGWEYKGTKVDTLLMSRTQRPNRTIPAGLSDRTVGPHSVEAWGKRLGRLKRQHDEWDKFSPEMLERCEQDVEIQLKIYEALLEEGKGEGWENAHRLNAKLFHYLQKQEEYGWLVDRALLESCLTTLDRWIGRIDRAVAPRLPLITEPLETKKGGEYGWVRKPFTKSGQYSTSAGNYFGDTVSLVSGPFSRVGFRHVDPDSNQEIKAFLLAQGWEPNEWNSNNEGKRTSPKLSKDDDFIGIRGGLGKLVAKRIQCKQRKSILEGWRDSLRPDGRLTPSVAGMATTGRLRHKGLVNVPTPHSKAFFSRQMRSLFIVAPGMVLVGTDSKGNQVRQLAARMGDEEFTNAVLHGSSLDGTDFHSLNQKRTGIASRNLVKNFFYGTIFGAGDAKVGKILGKSTAEAKRVKEEYFRNMPKLKQFLDRETEAWRKSAQKWYNKKYNRMEYKNGYIRGLDGRPILVEAEHTILVYYLQSDEAIQMATAYCILNKWLEKEGYAWGVDYGFVIWMHDEWQIECRKDIANRVSELSNEAIAWAGRFYNIACPHEGESKIGLNWFQTH